MVLAARLLWGDALKCGIEERGDNVYVWHVCSEIFALFLQSIMDFRSHHDQVTD